MTSFLPLIPVYLLGNLHCMGMCGPLVALLARHPARWGYFAGRGLSFSLAGAIAGYMGSVLGNSLAYYHIPATTSLLFGVFILLFAFSEWHPGFLARASGLVTKRLAAWLSSPLSMSPFLVGFFTVFLPCGQSLFVFSASALLEDPLMGMLNAALFAFLTSPSLAASFLIPTAMLRHPFGKKAAAFCMGAIAIQSILRGAADLGLVNHCTIVTLASCHITLF